MRKRSRKLGRLTVSLDLIKWLLNLPEEITITGIRKPIDKDGIIEFLVEHPYLQDIPEGGEIPLISKEELGNAGYDR